MDKNNVISFMARLEKNRKKGSGAIGAPLKAKAADVVDMTERRQEIIQQERRQVKRTILTEFIGACVVIPNKGLLEVVIYDISENGIAFDMSDEVGAFVEGEEVAMRVYMNHQTYFPFIVKVQNTRSLQNDGVTRIGAHFVKGTINDKALHHFIKFIEEVSASLERDGGDVMVSNITR